MVNAVIIVIAIWVVIIAALAVWFFAARSRTRRRDTGAHLAERPRGTGDDVALGGPLAEATGQAAPFGDLIHNPAAGLGDDETRPVQPLSSDHAGQFTRPTRPRAPQAPAEPPRDEPFGITTQEEYERLAAEEFRSPPATALGEAGTHAPFSWSAATEGTGADLPPVVMPTIDEPPVVAPPRVPAAAPMPPAAVSPPPPPLQQPVTLSADASEYGGVVPADDLDRTIMVAAEPEFDWELVLPDGTRLPIDPDTVVGRRPLPVDGSALLQIVDPTRTLSKSHARLRFRDGAWRVTDLDSTNGLWLLHDDGREEAIPPYREVDATPRLRLGTLTVELRRGFA